MLDFRKEEIPTAPARMGPDSPSEKMSWGLLLTHVGTLFLKLGSHYPTPLRFRDSSTNASSPHSFCSGDSSINASIFTALDFSKSHYCTSLALSECNYYSSHNSCVISAIRRHWSSFKIIFGEFCIVVSRFSTISTEASLSKVWLCHTARLML